MGRPLKRLPLKFRLLCQCARGAPLFSRANMSVGGRLSASLRKRSTFDRILVAAKLGNGATRTKWNGLETITLNLDLGHEHIRAFRKVRMYR